MNIQLHYEECGSGDVLILLHGNGENGGYFEHQMPAFAQRFRTIAVDTRGHGKSPRGTAPFTISQFADDLNAFMDRLGIEKAHLLGFSDGANIAMAFARKYPWRVDRLVLDGGNLNPWGVKLPVQIPIVFGYLSCALISLFDKKAVSKREMLGLMVNQPRLRPRDLTGLTMPSMVMAGTRDMIRDSHTRKIAAALPEGRLCLLDGDHFVAHEHPQAFNAAVLSFLTGEEDENAD